MVNVYPHDPVVHTTRKPERYMTGDPFDEVDDVPSLGRTILNFWVCALIILSLIPLGWLMGMLCVALVG